MTLDEAKARLRAADFVEIENTPLWINAGEHTATIAAIVVSKDGAGWRLATWGADTVENE